MDTHRPPKTKNILRAPIQQTSNPPPRLHKQSSVQEKLTTSKKHSSTQMVKNKLKLVQNDEEGASSNEKSHDANLLYMEEGANADSDFEFSAEIMEHNPRQESRQCREKGKLCHLTIYDWMMKVSTILKLSKQCFYRGLIIMKKFMFLDQKLPTYKVNLSNVNIYGLTALLISSKFENINGNFLASLSHIADSNSGQINKYYILECEMYIMSTMRFQVGNCSIIIETILAVLDAWTETTLHSNLAIFTFSRFEELGAQEENYIKVGNNQEKGLLERFIYLIDFMLIRKLVELRVKDIKSVDNQAFFRKMVSNVLFHLISYLISKSPQQIRIQQQKTYQKVFRLMTAKLEIPRQQLPILQRKSHILSKQIRSIFSKTSTKFEHFRKIKETHYKIASSYCLCHIKSLSTKYLGSQSIQKQAKTTFPPGFSRREDEYDTDPLASSSAIQPANKLILRKNEEMELAGLSSHGQVAKYCPKCINSSCLLREIANQQFYVSLLVSDT